MPPRKFTAEDRAKGVETRKRNLEQKRLAEQQAVVGTATTTLVVDGEVLPVNTEVSIVTPPFKVEHPRQSVRVEHLVEPFDWWNVPLAEAQVHLNDMKQEYDRAAQIILQRTSQAPQPPLTCWVWDNRTSPGISKAAIHQCKRNIPDRAKAAFCNDGHKDDPKDPAEKVRSVYCCSMLCFMAYQQTRPIGGLSRH